MNFVFYFSIMNSGILEITITTKKAFMMSNGMKGITPVIRAPLAGWNLSKFRNPNM